MGINYLRMTSVMDHSKTVTLAFTYQIFEFSMLSANTSMNFYGILICCQCFRLCGFVWSCKWGLAPWFNFYLFASIMEMEALGMDLVEDDILHNLVTRESQLMRCNIPWRGSKENRFPIHADVEWIHNIGGWCCS